MITLTVFISGRGSNLKILLENQHLFKIVHIISNNPNADGLRLGKIHHIPTSIIPNQLENSIQNVIDTTKKIPSDLIVLAGFMRILPKVFISTFKQGN